MQVNGANNSYATEPQGVHLVLRRGLAHLPPRVAVNLVCCEACLVYEHNVGLLLHQLNHSRNKLAYSVASSCFLLCGLHKLLVYLSLLDAALLVNLPQAIACDRCRWVAVVECLAPLCDG